MRVQSIDHVVLTVSDVDATCAFYAQLGLSVVRGRGRVTLHAGDQRIVLQEVGRERKLQAARPTPGSTSLCFAVNTSGRQVKRRLASRGVSTVEGPVERPGTHGPVRSVYVRDPDGNLVELASYARAEPPRDDRSHPPQEAESHPPQEVRPPREKARGLSRQPR